MMNKSFILRCCLIVVWSIFFILGLWIVRYIPSLGSRDTLKLLAWADMFDAAYIKNFEKQYNVRVLISTYDSNDELIVKLRTTQGADYDLIVASDYAVDVLRKEQLLQKLQRDKLVVYNTVNPLLQHLPYDPQAAYSLPFGWDVFGIGIDRGAFEHMPQPSWDLVFNNHGLPYHVIMVNDPLEAILFAGHYLYGPLTYLDDTRIEGIKQILLVQKKYVEAYADYRSPHFLATRQCAVIVVAASYLYRVKSLFSYIDFLIPQEGTFIAIETLAIPVHSQKVDLAHLFINFICSQDSYKHHMSLYHLMPARLDVVDAVCKDPFIARLAQPTREEFSRYSLLRPLISDQQKFDLWVALK